MKKKNIKLKVITKCSDTNGVPTPHTQRIPHADSADSINEKKPKKNISIDILLCIKIHLFIFCLFSLFILIK